MLETALSIGYVSLFLWIIGKSPFYQEDTIKNRTFQWLFLLKIAAGYSLFLVYTCYYPDRKYADIFRYYDDSNIIYQSFFNHPYDFFRMITGFHQNNQDLMVYYDKMNNWFNSEMIFNDARTMIRLNVIFRFFSAGTYYPHSLFFCFLAFTGLTGMYKIVASELRKRNGFLLAAIFCMPSVLFWTSGVIKESFLVFAIGMMMYFLKKIAEKKGNSLYTISAAIFFIFCLLNIKSYVFFAICPGLIAYLLVKRNGNHALLKFTAIHLFYFICLYFLSATITHHPIPELLKSKQQEFYALAEREQAKSVIHLPVLKPEFFSILTNTPNAFLITLFRPHLLESHNSMMLLSALENTLITILIFINIYFLFYKKEKRMIISPLLLVSFFFVIITFCLIGLVTPVLGAVVRYKVAALPFLMIILLYQDKWQSVFSIFKLFTAKR